MFRSGTRLRGAAGTTGWLRPDRGHAAGEPAVRFQPGRPLFPARGPGWGAAAARFSGTHRNDLNGYRLSHTSRYHQPHANRHHLSHGNRHTNRHHQPDANRHHQPHASGISHPGVDSLVAGTEEPSAAEPGRSNEPGFGPAVDFVTRVVAPVSLLTAILYYFGYMREHALFGYFGVDLGSLRFSNGLPGPQCRDDLSPDRHCASVRRPRDRRAPSSLARSEPSRR